MNIKFKLLIPILLFLTLYSYSQESKIEKSIYGIQTGVYGLWGYNETKLINNTVLRTEIGTDVGFGTSYSIANPTISVEPKWYYNINKRSKKGKDTQNNSANFISVQTKYYFDNILDYTTVEDPINRVLKSNLTWGIRRNISELFNYEAGIGFGIQRNFNTNKTQPSINVQLRIGVGF